MMADGTPPPVPPDNSDELSPRPEEEAKDSPEVVHRAVSKIAERQPEGITDIMAMMGTMTGHPLHQKVNEAHITQVLRLAVTHDEHEFQLRKRQLDIESSRGHWERFYHTVYFVLLSDYWFLSYGSSATNRPSWFRF